MEQKIFSKHKHEFKLEPTIKFIFNCFEIFLKTDIFSKNRFSSITQHFELIIIHLQQALQKSAMALYVMKEGKYTCNVIAYLSVCLYLSVYTRRLFKRLW